jgi:urease accessory protein
MTLVVTCLSSTSPRMIPARFLPTGALLLCATPLLAHPGHTEDAAPFIAGLTHPWVGVDHFIAMLTVGLLAVRLNNHTARWALPTTFVSAMLVGGTLAAIGLPMPGTEWLIASSVVMLGALVALAAPVRSWIAYSVVALAGLPHGHAHVAELVGSLAPYMVGFAVGTALLHALGVTGGLLLARSSTANPVALRAGGTLAGLAGIALFTQLAGS